jgi:hypothetical protein
MCETLRGKLLCIRDPASDRSRAQSYARRCMEYFFLFSDEGQREKSEGEARREIEIDSCYLCRVLCSRVSANPRYEAPRWL